MSWAVEFHEQYVFDVELQGTQHSSYASRRSGPWVGECDVNYDSSGTHKISFATEQPTQIVFVPPRSTDPDSFRPGSLSQPYMPYVPITVEADFERQSTSTSEGNPECQAGGGGGEDPPPSPPPPDCGLKETLLQTQLEYTGLVSPHEPFLVRGQHLEEPPYRNCTFGGHYSQKLLDATGVGRFSPAELRNTGTQLFLFAGENSDSRDDSYQEGQKVNESRSSTSIDWKFSLLRRADESPAEAPPAGGAFAGAESASALMAGRSAQLRERLLDKPVTPGFRPVPSTSENRATARFSSSLCRSRLAVAVPEVKQRSSTLGIVAAAGVMFAVPNRSCPGRHQL